MRSVYFTGKFFHFLHTDYGFYKNVLMPLITCTLNSSKLFYFGSKTYGNLIGIKASASLFFSCNSKIFTKV